MSSDGFWSNQESAKSTVAELKHLKVRLDPLTRMERGLEELELTLELVSEDPTEANVTDAETLARTVEKAMEAFEFRVMLGGEYDSRSAYLSVQAGAGGTESCDWAAMLLRMYARWAERQGYEVEVIDRLDGEEAGIKSATVLVKGDWAYGYLRAEAERDATLKGLKGEQTDIGWGHQIRSYVLHPYQMVKDHRTDHETGNTAAVLDGDIQEFIETYLRSRK